VGPEEEGTLGWRPAVSHGIPGREEWTLERKLGEGGFGEVWLARHTRTHELRTFKFCFKAERQRMLKRELTLFRLMKEVLGERPDIARLYDVRLSEAPYYLEMDYTEGGDLTEWTERQGGIETVALETRLELVAQAAEALAAAHSVGVIHKDVKPTNILIEEKKDGTVQARLTDFGIGQLAKREVLAAAGITGDGFSTRSSTMLSELSSKTGTRLYMAPELLAGKPPSIQSDVYALGVMLYQVVVGDLTHPLGQGWEREVEDELLREDIGACVDGEPQRRLNHASELTERLWSLTERRAQREAEQRASLLAQRAQKRRQAFTMAAIAGLVLIVFLAVFAVRENQRAKNETQLRQEAEAAELLAAERADEAEQERQRAATEVETAQQVISFLVDTFNVSDPWTASQLQIDAAADEPPGETITARQILEAGSAKLERELDDQPEIKARLMETIGLIYCNLANYEAGIGGAG
jgi:serine/threonine protein kinase